MTISPVKRDGHGLVGRQVELLCSDRDMLSGIQPCRIKAGSGISFDIVRGPCTVILRFTVCCPTSWNFVITKVFYIRIVGSGGIFLCSEMPNGNVLGFAFRIVRNHLPVVSSLIVSCWQGVSQSVTYILSIEDVVNIFCCTHIQRIAFGKEGWSPLQLDVLRIDFGSAISRSYQ